MICYGDVFLLPWVHTCLQVDGGCCLLGTIEAYNMCQSMLLGELPAISELDIDVGNGHTKRKLTFIAIP